MKEESGDRSRWSHVLCSAKRRCEEGLSKFGHPKAGPALYRRWCREFGIPEQDLTLKFWLSGQYVKIKNEVMRLKDAEKLPIPKPPKVG